MKSEMQFIALDVSWLSGLLALFLLSGWLRSQETDLTQTPNAAGAGIALSFPQQVGAGHGDILTPGSSMFLIKRDPFRSIARGRQIFQRKFTLAQGLGPRTNDGVGNIEIDGSHGAGLTDSCAACHGRPRGAAGFGGDVFTRPDSRDAPHLFGLGLQEMLADEISKELRAIRAGAIQQAVATGHAVTRRLSAKGIHYGRIKALPNGQVETNRIVGVDTDLRVRPFFAEGTTISIREFLVGAFNAEMGLEAVDPLTLAASMGSDVVTPSGMELTGSIDQIEAPPVSGPLDDGDLDGVVDEYPTSVVDHMEFYLLNYFAPATYRQKGDEAQGRALLATIGCTDCHIPNLLIDNDRRVANVTTVYRPLERGFNGLFATASALVDVVPDTSGYAPQQLPAGEGFVVRGIFTDFKRHDLGPAFYERNFDGTMQTEFMTEPLWGVGSTAPYGHDGRSINLREVILRHGGEAAESRHNFRALPEQRQEKVIAFLSSLVLFGPPDTASNLDPAVPSTPGFPQFGHGSLKLSVLFNNPGLPE
jgi:hypothetical protein